MILTGKALEHYKIWFDKYYNDYWTYYQSKPTILNALIIEWFDSVGIYIELKRFCHGLKFRFWNYVISNSNGAHLNNFLEVEIENDSRQEATVQAIKKANEIYNSK